MGSKEMRISMNYQIGKLCIVHYPLILGALPQTPHTFLS